MFNILASSQYNWLIAVLLASLASFVSNLGLTLQKLQHQRNASSPSSVQRQYHCQKLWITGLVLIILGSLADFTALSFGPQSLIAPLGSLTLVSNAIFAPLLLKEHLSPNDIIATSIIIVGSTIAVIFASHDDKIYTMSELFDFYWRVPFAIYASFIVLFVVCVLIFVRHVERLEEQDPKMRVRYHIFYRLSYPSISGAIGAQSILFAKCSVELLVNTFHGSGLLFAHYQSYFVLAAMTTTIFLQIHWLNEGLRRYPASYTVPVFTAFWIVLSVTSGLIFYKEYQGMTWGQLGLFFFGVLVSIVGVYLLSMHGFDSGKTATVKNSQKSTPDLVRQDDDDSLDDDPTDSQPLIPA